MGFRRFVHARGDERFVIRGRHHDHVILVRSVLGLDLPQLLLVEGTRLALWLLAAPLVVVLVRTLRAVYSSIAASFPTKRSARLILRHARHHAFLPLLSTPTLSEWLIFRNGDGFHDFPNFQGLGRGGGAHPPDQTIGAWKHHGGS